MIQFNDSQVTLTEYKQITNWFDNLEEMFPNREGGTNTKGVEPTSPVVTLRSH